MDRFQHQVGLAGLVGERVAGQPPGRYYERKVQTIENDTFMSYRKPVLKGEAKRLRELVRQTCEQLDVYIISGHVSADHVHLLVSAPPHQAVSDLMQRIKGRSSRKRLSACQDHAYCCGELVC